MDLIEELAQQILEADRIAVENHIFTNAVCLNEEFDFAKEMGFAIKNEMMATTIQTKPMICGKHIFIGKLPKKYSFILTNVDEDLYKNELDYYKARCKDLEGRLDTIKSALGIPEDGEE